MENDEFASRLNANRATPAPSEPVVRRAVIDVGTNSVKLLVADVACSIVTPVLEQSEQTRLGQGFYETHQLQERAIRDTATAVAAFAALARQRQAASLHVVATSAARDAVNQDQLVQAIEAAAGVRPKIISGEQEAEWVFRGVGTDPNLHGQRLLILDVGGGSTEVILGAGEHHSFRRSFPLGSVRLLEILRPADPPSLSDLAGCRSWLKEYCHRQLGPALELLLASAEAGRVKLVGTGGTSTILARMAGQMMDFNREKIDGACLSRQRILEDMVHLWSLPLAERRKIVGLPPNRADIIIMGVAIYEAVMEYFDFPELYVSARGLRFGALMDRT